MEQMVRTEQLDRKGQKVIKEYKVTLVHKDQKVLMEQTEPMGLKDQQVMSDHRGQQVLME